MLQLLLMLCLIISVGALTVLLVKIRYQLCEGLVVLFIPFVCVGVALLKWFWHEPKRYKKARGAISG